MRLGSTGQSRAWFVGMQLAPQVLGQRARPSALLARQASMLRCIPVLCCARRDGELLPCSIALGAGAGAPGPSVGAQPASLLVSDVQVVVLLKRGVDGTCRFIRCLRALHRQGLLPGGGGAQRG